MLELFVAVVEEGSVGAGARRVGMAQPNASRALAELEAQQGAALLVRSPRGSAPTARGRQLADAARELLDAARRFTAVQGGAAASGVQELTVGASDTVAETLLPGWLAELKRRLPEARVQVQVLNSAQVLDEVQRGGLQLGFVETPTVPVRLNALVVAEDELVVVVAPSHEWAERAGRLSVQELAATPLVVREPGSGTGQALRDALAGYDVAEPVQVLGSNAAVRVAVEAGAGPAALSALAVRNQLAAGELLQVPVDGLDAGRPLTAVWAGPRRLTGAAAELVSVAAAGQPDR